MIRHLRSANFLSTLLEIFNINSKDENTNKSNTKYHTKNNYTVIKNG